MRINYSHFCAKKAVFLLNSVINNFIVESERIGFTKLLYVESREEEEFNFNIVATTDAAATSAGGI